MDLYIPRFIEQKKPFELGLSATVSAKYKVAVCRNGHVVRRPFGDKWLPNVITNVGLDALMQGTFFYSFIGTSARAGSGTTAPAVTDTALTTPLKGTGTQFTGGGTGTTLGSSNDTVNGACTHTNVFEFSAEGSTVTYNEVGLANTNGPTGGTLYTHALLPSGVTLNSGDNLRLTYAVTFSIPLTVTPLTVSLSAINGFNISGQLKVVGVFQYGIFGQMISSGGTNGGMEGYFRNSAVGYGIMCTAPSTFPPVNSDPRIGAVSVGSAASGSLGTYTAGSFTRTQSFVWVPSNPPATTSGITCIYFGFNSINANYGYLMLLLSAAQTKANTNTLTINTSCTLARV